MFSISLRNGSLYSIARLLLSKRSRHIVACGIFIGRPTWLTRPRVRTMCDSSKLANTLASSAKTDQSRCPTTSKTHGEDHDQRTIFIREFRPDTPKSSLEACFGNYGTVEDVSIIRTASGKSKGFGYVTYEKADSAVRALAGSHFIENRWIIAEPKMLTKSLAGRSKKVRVQNISQDMTQDEIEGYFTQFGPVKGVDFVIVDPITKMRKDYCFVAFESEEDAANAVETLSHVICNCKVQVQFSTSRFSHLPHTKEIIVRCLPNDTTVELLKEYFSIHGDIARVDLICNRHPQNSNTFAFIKFENPDVAKIAAQAETHFIAGQEVVVKRTALKYPMKYRHLKVFVEGLPPQSNPKELKEYFSKFGHVSSIKENQLRWQGNTTVAFKSPQAVKNTLALKEHKFNGNPFVVRQLCWTKELGLFDLVNNYHFTDKRRPRR